MKYKVAQHTNVIILFTYYFIKINTKKMQQQFREYLNFQTKKTNFMMKSSNYKQNSIGSII